MLVFFILGAQCLLLTAVENVGFHV